jgi:uncharacterized protein YbaP (TraB family)
MTASATGIAAFGRRPEAVREPMRPALRLLAAIALFALFAAGGCAKTAPQAAQGPALWRISDKDSEIWLFGTVHVLPPTLKWRGPKIERAFDGAETIYFETATDAPAQSTIAAMVQRYGYNKPGVALSSLISGADRARLARICAKLHIAPAQLEPARPWLAAVQISVAEVMAQGQAQAAGVEQVLDADARAHNKKRAYFESAEEQIRFFADLDTEVQLQFLSATLREIENEPGDVDTLDQAWARGDVKTLSRELNRDLRSAGPEIYAALIRDRNRRWADEIDTMMKGSGTAFIAVGAAHLVGKDGVPALLRAKGYVVEGP